MYFLPDLPLSTCVVLNVHDWTNFKLWLVHSVPGATSIQTTLCSCQIYHRTQYSKDWQILQNRGLT